MYRFRLPEVFHGLKFSFEKSEKVVVAGKGVDTVDGKAKKLRLFFTDSLTMLAFNGIR